ncbi:MAG: aldo/keto reductase [Cyclobacteriaceae bacterium]
MNYRTFGRLGWQVSDIGYGMWGMAGWTGSDDDQSENSLDLAVELGCNFFDTAWGYGEGKSEELLGALVKRYPNKKLYTATKVPPKNFTWPSQSHFKLEDVFPYDHITEYTEKSLKNLDMETVDLLQFHVWEDAWANQDEWKRAVEQLKQDGKIQGIGLSLNRWEPNNGLKTIHTGLIDAVQVIYNIFDQAPEDQLFPLCEEKEIGVIARVPFDEGTLTGTFTHETTFPEDDWRSTYFVPENLHSSVEHADAVKALLPEDISMPEAALKFILANPTVSTIIPGMRKARHVQANISCSDSEPLPADVLLELKKHRWDREPTEWSQ